MNYLLKTCLQAFELRDYIRGDMSGGIEAPRIINSMTVKDDVVDIKWTYPATCGYSDVRYHYIDAGKEFHEIYLIRNKKIFIREKNKWNRV